MVVEYVMNHIFVISAFICMISDVSISQEPDANIIDYSNFNDGSGNYYFRFLTSNGIQREEKGEVRNPGQNNQFIYVSGFYTYTDPDGHIVKIYYASDDKGYKILPSPEAEKLPPISTISSPALVGTLLG